MVHNAKRLNNSPRRLDRLNILVIFFLILAILIAWRLFRLQILEGSFFRAVAADQHSLYRELIPERGEVYVGLGESTNELQPIAINEQRSLVYAVPAQIDDPVEAADKLAEILELEDESKQVILNRLSKEGDLYEPIKHKVSKNEVERIESLKIAGINFLPEPIRVYPLKEIFGNITGFLGFAEEEKKQVGRYGVEQYFQDELAGEPGYLAAERDPRGYLISLADRTFTPAQNGTGLVLTLDPNVQARTCQLLQDAVIRHEASGGSVVVMEPNTGAIEALCVNPSFDPNNYGQVEDINTYLNQAVSLPWEPGSIFKVITMAAALDSEAVTPDTKYIDEGKIEFKDFTIRNSDHKVYGESDMNSVLQNSINTGAVFAALQTGRRQFRDYLHKFGFGEPTGIELPAELAGDISALENEGEIFTATASFGQGITVTPIQMLRAVAVIANKGTLVKPHIVKAVLDQEGNMTPVATEKVRTVIEPQTAITLSAMMVSVVEEGYGDKARVPGFYVAGKTGTAQVAGSSGYGEDTIHSFIGFAPISRPRFVALVKLDRPQKGRFAASTAAPVFRNLATFLLQYYQTTPER